jgi:hypothetical protein
MICRLQGRALVGNPRIICKHPMAKWQRILTKAYNVEKTNCRLLLSVKCAHICVALFQLVDTLTNQLGLHHMD